MPLRPEFTIRFHSDAQKYHFYRSVQKSVEVYDFSFMLILFLDPVHYVIEPLLYIFNLIETNTNGFVDL